MLSSSVGGGQLDVQPAGGRVELELAEELAEVLRGQRRAVRDRAVLAGQDRAGVPHLRLDRHAHLDVAR